MMRWDKVVNSLTVIFSVLGIIWISIGWVSYGYRDIAFVVPIVAQTAFFAIRALREKTTKISINRRDLVFNNAKLKEGEAKKILEALDDE